MQTAVLLMHQTLLKIMFFVSSVETLNFLIIVVFYYKVLYCRLLKQNIYIYIIIIIIIFTC